MKKLSPAKTRILQYSITSGVCLLLCFIYALAAGIFNNWEVVYENTNWNITGEVAKNMFILTNAFFSVGIVTACIGLFILAANGGAFEMLVYGVRRFFSIFQKDPNKIKFKTYYDYHVYRSEQEPTPFAFLIVVGSSLVAISLLFLFFYYQYN